MPEMCKIAKVTAFSNLTEREAAYTRIQEEIAASERVTRSWKSRNNELSLISRLPAELLSTIFKLTRDFVSQPGQQWYGHKGRTDMSWIRVSHICTHWRCVALGCPTLWTKITFRSHKWAEEMLIRSKMAPLEITFDLTSEFLSPNKKTGIISTAQSSRIKDLRLFQGSYWGERPPMLHDVIQPMVGPFPLLEICNIEFPSLKDENSLPDTFFSDSPKLQHLTLAKCGLKWESLVLGNLRQLSVHTIPQALQPPVHQVLLALSYMSQLDSLSLCFNYVTTSKAGTSAPESLDVANLPSLKTLTIRSHLQDCIVLLDHIIYPNTAVVNVTSEISGTVPASHEIFHGLAEQLEQRLIGPIRSLRIHDDMISLITSLGNEGTTNFDNPYLLEQVTLRMHSIGYDLLAQWLASSVRALSLHHLEFMNIEGVGLEPADWLSAFGNLSMLKSIQVGYNSENFLLALLNSTQVPPVQSIETLPLKFQALRHLTASRWLLDMDIGGKTCMTTLRECLEERRKKGAGLLILDLEDCRHIKEMEVDQLREVVEHVEWDEQSNYTTEEEDLEGCEFHGDDCNGYEYDSDYGF